MAQLPSQTMPFIGRADEVAAIAARLAEPGCGLLTLVGPGGIGKTRLAIEVAKHIAGIQPFPDGVFFVDLQPVTSADLLVTTIANTLSLFISGSEPPRTQLLNYLNGHHSLLLLDNFEQLLSSVGLLADILKTAPGVKMLVTSREALNLQEEWVWQVGGLQVPDEQLESIESYSAVQLFIERARRVRQNFTLIGQETHVARTCQLVEGMPLALELAASWTKALPCAEIANEIQHGLDFLTTKQRNVLERHQSMQAVFDHSWHLLTEAEREAFPQLTVFHGGFRREAAEQVADASLAVLAGLVDKSFLRLDDSGRYSLQELIRQYGEEHLKIIPGATKDTQHRHCLYYTGFLYQRQPILRTPGQANALDEIETEFDNIRAAWEWAAEHHMLTEIHQSMHSLYLFCHIRAQAVEGERLFRQAVKQFEDEDSATLAYLLLATSCISGFNGRKITKDEFTRALRLADTFWTSDIIALQLRAYVYRFIPEGAITTQPEWQFMSRFLEIFQSHNQLWGTAFMMHCLGDVFSTNGILEEAEKYYLESLDSFQKLGDAWGAAWPLMGLAWVYYGSGKYQLSLQYWQQHQENCAEVGDHGGVVFALTQKALCARKLQDHRLTRLLLSQAIQFHLETGSQFMHFASVFQPLIAMFVSEGNYERAAEVSSFLRQNAGNAIAPKYMEEANEALDQLIRKLSPEDYHQAVERGKNLHLWTILEQLQQELENFSPPEKIGVQVDALTERELEVLRLTAAGHSNRQIADELVLTLNTIKSHIHHIYGKLGVASRTQAVARARELNLL